jgi:hypothetical protein
MLTSVAESTPCSSGVEVRVSQKGIGVGVGVGVGVDVGVAVGVGVDFGVSVGVSVGTAVGGWVGVSVAAGGTQLATRTTSVPNHKSCLRCESVN